MSKISLDIKQASVVTSTPLGDADLARIAEVVKARTGREIALSSKVDAGHLAGVIIQFGSLQLDGSLKTAIKDVAVALKSEAERDSQKK